jgi:hypothetical protein
MSSQLMSELFLGLELLRNATSFAISQGVLLHLSCFLCCSVLNTHTHMYIIRYWHVRKQQENVSLLVKKVKLDDTDTIL